MKCGTAKADITNPDASVHDPLFAKVLVIRAEGKCAALISMDCVSLGGGIGGLSDRFFPTLKQDAHARGVDCLLCGTTHTHTPGRMLASEEVVLSRVEAALVSIEQQLGIHS